MKVLKRDLRHGRIIVRTENLDDLWYLSQILREGDIVKGRTERRIKGKDDKVRGDEGRREKIVLAIKVEKPELDQNANRLRILGQITEGPDDLISFGSHHTFEVDDNTSITIIKERWRESELQYLRDAEQSAKRAKILICIVGDGEATLAVVRESGINYVDTKENIGGKYVPGREEKKLQFYADLEKLLTGQLKKESADKAIVGGTGFEKRNFYDYLVGKNSDAVKKIVVVDTGSEGKNGVNEVLKGGAVEKIAAETRIAREAKLVEKLLLGISKNEPVVYSLDETKKALDYGAIETLLVSDKYFREKRDLVEKIIEGTKRARGEFFILNSKYEPGEKLNGLGCIAAILRYKI